MNEAAVEELIATARSTIKARFRQGRHHVAAALVTANGVVFTAVHPEASIGRMAVCAEAIALGSAAAAGDATIDTIVAVDRTGAVIPPCGMCRELIADYSPNAKVIVADAPKPMIESIQLLLPNKFR